MNNRPRLTKNGHIKVVKYEAREPEDGEASFAQVWECIKSELDFEKIAAAYNSQKTKWPYFDKRPANPSKMKSRIKSLCLVAYNKKTTVQYYDITVRYFFEERAIYTSAIFDNDFFELITLT